MFALERLGGMRALGVVGSLPAALFQSSSDSQHRAAWASMPRGVQWYLCWVGLGVKSVTRCLHTNLLPKKDLSFNLCKSICFLKVWQECGSNEPYSFSGITLLDTTPGQTHVISIFHDIFPRCFHGLLNSKARSWQVTQKKLWARPFSVSSAINSSPFFLLLLGFASYDVISVFVHFSRSLRISREENTNLNWGFKCHRCWWHLNTVSSMRERGRRGVPTMGAWESSTKLTNPRRKKQAPWSKKMRSSHRTTWSVIF